MPKVIKVALFIRLRYLKEFQKTMVLVVVLSKLGFVDLYRIGLSLFHYISSAEGGTQEMAWSLLSVESLIIPVLIVELYYFKYIESDKCQS